MITVSFAYNNHRGVSEARTVDVWSIDFRRNPGFGYQPGWFITGHCHDRKAIRSFALSHIVLPPDTDLYLPIDRLSIEGTMILQEHVHGNEDKGYSGTHEEGSGGSASGVGDTE